MRYRDVGVVTFDRAQVMPGFTLIVPLPGAGRLSAPVLW
jgi:hypothetical protein